MRFSWLSLHIIAYRTNSFLLASSRMRLTVKNTLATLASLADRIMTQSQRCTSRCRSIGVIAKIEDADSLKCLDDIILVSDGVMVARGDLGAQMPLEQVPSVQETVVDACRKLNKPVIVASQLLESMIEYPTPTRAEVSLSCMHFG